MLIGCHPCAVMEIAAKADESGAKQALRKRSSVHPFDEEAAIGKPNFSDECVGDAVTQIIKRGIL